MSYLAMVRERELDRRTRFGVLTCALADPSSRIIKEGRSDRNIYVPQEWDHWCRDPNVAALNRSLVKLSPGSGGCGYWLVSCKWPRGALGDHCYGDPKFGIRVRGPNVAGERCSDA